MMTIDAVTVENCEKMYVVLTCVLSDKEVVLVRFRGIDSTESLLRVDCIPDCRDGTEFLRLPFSNLDWSLKWVWNLLSQGLTFGDRSHSLLFFRRTHLHAVRSLHFRHDVWSFLSFVQFLNQGVKFLHFYSLLRIDFLFVVVPFARFEYLTNLFFPVLV